MTQRTAATASAGEQAAAAADRAERTGSLVYLYCIVDADAPAAAHLEQRPVAGVDPGEPLFALQTGGLAAVISFVPAAVFEEEPLNQLVTDLTRIAPYAVRHEQAIRSLLEYAPALLPMAFGCVYRSPEPVLAMLRDRATELAERLGYLRNRQEWEVKVYRRPADLIASLMAPGASGTEVESEPSAGHAYLAARLRERRLAADAASRTTEVLQAIYERLNAGSAAVRADPIQGANTGGSELIYRISALVDRPAAEQVRALVDELQQTYDSAGFTLELTGPWAPYSFAAWDGDAD